MAVAAYASLVKDLEAPAVMTAFGPVTAAEITLWTKERDFHAKVCKMALDAGIDARRLALVEQDADQLYEAVREGLNAAGLNPAQEAKFREAFSAALRRAA